MTTYLTIWRADIGRAEHCAVSTRCAAINEINHCLFLADMSHLCLMPRPRDDGKIDDEFRDKVARHLGENNDANTESVLPLAITEDPTGWEIREHPVNVSDELLVLAAEVVVGRRYNVCVTVEQIDILEDLVAVHVCTEGHHLRNFGLDFSGSLLRQYLRVSGKRWRAALLGVMSPLPR